MSGLYAVRADGASLTAAGSLIEITAPADGILEVTRIRVGQSNQSASEQSEVIVRRMSSASTGSSATPAPLGGFAAAGATARIPTFTADGSASTTIFDEGFNLLAGWEWVAVSEFQRIVVPPSGILNVRLDVAPAAARTMFALIEFVEKD